MTTHQKLHDLSTICVSLCNDQNSKLPGHFRSGHEDNTANKHNQPMSRFTYDGVIGHWEYINKTVAKAYAEIILKLLWSGSTYGELIDGIGTWIHGKPSPGVAFVTSNEFEPEKNDKITDLWLTCLPRWRLRRIENEVIRILQEYGWESVHISLSKGKEDEVVLEWEVNLPAELIAQHRQ